MTTYNTGNPVGSTAVKDFYDNSQNLDIAVNDKDSEFWVDRLGTRRNTLRGVENRIGYLSPVDYSPGLSVPYVNFTVTYGGVIYHAKSEYVPFITEAAFDSNKWMVLQQAALVGIHELSDDPHPRMAADIEERIHLHEVATDPHPQLTAQLDAAVAQAESAADAALIDATLYATESDGRAAVADGQNFKVVGTGDIAAFVYRRDSSTTSTLLTSYPASQAIAKVVDLASLAESVAAVIQKSPIGVVIPQTLDLELDSVPGADRLIQSASGISAATVTDDGYFEAHTAPAQINVQTGLRAGINHILGIGQSWMGGTGSEPAITTATRPGILMFVGGVRPKDSLNAPDCFASLVPAVESNIPTGGRGETPMGGFSRAFADYIEAAESRTLTQMGASLLVSVVAPGGQALGRFTRNNTYWGDIVEQINAGFSRAQDFGETYRLIGCPVMLGKGDYDAGEVDETGYLETLRGLFRDISDYVRTLVPNHPDVPAILYHSGSHGHDSRYPSIDTAANKLDRSDQNFIYGGILSVYMRADAAHFINTSTYAAGACGGAQFARWITSGVRPSAMLPVEFDVQGKVISMRFSPPTRPLVLDSAAVSSPANEGFSLRDASDVEQPIASVTLKGDRVVVVATSALPTGWKLRYAWYGTPVASTVSGPRGSIRDSSAQQNWAGTFEINSTM